MVQYVFYKLILLWSGKFKINFYFCNNRAELGEIIWSKLGGKSEKTIQKCVYFGKFSYICDTLFYL